MYIKLCNRYVSLCKLRDNQISRDVLSLVDNITRIAHVVPSLVENIVALVVTSLVDNITSHFVPLLTDMIAHVMHR